LHLLKEVQRINKYSSCQLLGFSLNAKPIKRYPHPRTISLEAS
jgi:hypothetical protein